MKKISLFLAIVLLVVFASTTIFASGEDEVTQVQEGVVSANPIEEAEDPKPVASDSKKKEDSAKPTPELSKASKTTQRNLTAKEEEIQGYMKSKDEGGSGLSRTDATVLYYLHLLQVYSYPVCFVGLAIASLNFFIIGNKKLEKREQGFRMLVTLIIGLIVFQVLPLLYAIIVAGR